MTANDINGLKKQLGEKTFNSMYPQYATVGKSKPVSQILVKDPIVVTELMYTLVGVAEGKQTATINFVRQITGWTVKVATTFVKEGDFPKQITGIIVSKEELIRLETESGINPA